MSAAELTATAPPRPVRAISPRFLVSELMLIFGRRRNWAGMAVLASVPVIIGVVIKIWAAPGAGEGPPFFSGVTENGVFVALAALTVELPLFLPLAVAAISGDAIAGEANLGTLRYLLTVPVHRTRLLLTKFAGLVVFAFAAVVLVASVGAVLGLALFGGGEMTTLSGTQIGMADGLWRLLLVCLYITACLSAVAAIGMFVSTLTEQPIGATIAILMLTLISQILDSIPQLSPVHAYLPSHYWLAFGDLLRDPMATGEVQRGLLSAGAYVLVFGAAAWARFGVRDVSS
jgi:ABC-2 type transport system permease protein